MVRHELRLRLNSRQCRPPLLRLPSWGGTAAAPAAPWPSTGTGVALRLDAARRRYLLLRILGHELRRDELAAP